MRIGILECGPTPAEIAARHGTYPTIFADLLSGHGWSFPSWCVHEMEFPDSVEAADGWLLTGSRYGAYEDLPFMAPLEDFIRKARAANRPMTGICFGHQIMAQALGGQVEKAAGGWTFGRQVYAFDGVGPLAVTAIHQDQVTRAPEGAQIVARNAGCPIAGLRYGDWGLSVQAHPEFDQEMTAGFIEIKEQLGDVPAPLIAQARAGLDRPLDRAAVARMLADVYKAALGHPTHPEDPAGPVAASLHQQRSTQNG
jgi:GMP synthase (glutamine-hydrolysing)